MVIEFLSPGAEFCYAAAGAGASKQGVALSEIIYIQGSALFLVL
jgi:hypothetical protein